MAFEMTDPRPPLSIVIAATQPWPEARGCLDSLHAQARRAGAEIIVADGTGRSLPDDARYPGIKRLEAPGRTVFQLRALAMAEAAGEIVAVTEDHCRAAPDWCEAILRAHREFPDAAVVGGAVDNGATGRLADWANFLASNDRFISPLPTGYAADVAGQACISYKRRALPSAYPAAGIVESHHKAFLAARGEKFVGDGRIAVVHVQSFGFSGSCFIHYHEGRTTAGFRRARMSPRARLFGVAKCLALPLRVAVATARITARTIARSPRHLRPALASLPLVAVLLSCHTAGELAGYLSGPGASPRWMR